MTTIKLKLLTIALTSLALLTACGEDDDGGGGSADNPCFGKETDYGVIWCSALKADFDQNELVLFEGGRSIPPTDQLLSIGDPRCADGGDTSRYLDGTDVSAAVWFLRGDELEELRVRRTIEPGEANHPDRQGDFIIQDVAFTEATFVPGCQTVEIVRDSANDAWSTRTIHSLPAE